MPDQLLDHIAYIETFYGISDDPRYKALIREACHQRPSRSVLLQMYRKAKKPAVDQRVTDGLSPKQLELFNLLREHMHPRTAKQHATYFVP